MGIKDIILQKVLKVVDDTIGKKFKIIDRITDLLQGAEARIDDLNDRITKLERDYENQHEKKGSKHPNTEKKSKG